MQCSFGEQISFLLRVIWRWASYHLVAQCVQDVLSSPLSCQEEQDISLLSMNVNIFNRLSNCLHIHISSRLFDGLTCKDKGLGSHPFFAHSHRLLLHEEQCQERRLKETLPLSSPGGRFIRNESISFDDICKQNGYNCGAF